MQNPRKPSEQSCLLVSMTQNLYFSAGVLPSRKAYTLPKVELTLSLPEQRVGLVCSVYILSWITLRYTICWLTYSNLFLFHHSIFSIPTNQTNVPIRNPHPPLTLTLLNLHPRHATQHSLHQNNHNNHSPSSHHSPSLSPNPPPQPNLHDRCQRPSHIPNPNQLRSTHIPDLR